MVVPAHRLDTIFDVIVNSATRQDTDKRRLWEHAFRELGSRFGFKNSLLIDNSETCIEWFRESGGTAYQYTDENHLATWLADGRS